MPLNDPNASEGHLRLDSSEKTFILAMSRIRDKIPDMEVTSCHLLTDVSSLGVQLNIDSIDL